MRAPDEHPQMTCRELVAVVTDHLEGVLGGRDRLRLDSHVRTCASCATYLEQMRATVAALGALTQNAIASEAHAALLTAFGGRRARGT